MAQQRNTSSPSLAQSTSGEQVHPLTAQPDQRSFPRRSLSEELPQHEDREPENVPLPLDEVSLEEAGDDSPGDSSGEFSPDPALPAEHSDLSEAEEELSLEGEEEESDASSEVQWPVNEQHTI